MRVLVAEDDRGLREVLGRGLRENGYTVDAVPDGRAAMDYLRSYDYAVVVLDWRMPRVSGLEVLQWMRRSKLPGAVLMLTGRDAPAGREVREGMRRSKLPARVLMLTAGDAPGDGVPGLDRGPDDSLIKPFDFTEL